MKDFKKNLKHNWKNYVIGVLLLLVVGFMFVGTTSTSSFNSISYDGAYESKMVADTSSYYGGDAALGVESRQVIKNGNLQLETQNYDSTKTSIEDLASQYNAVILNMNENVNNDDNRYSTYNLKVKAIDLDELVERLESLAEVNSVNIYSNDVTGTYVDYEDRLARYEEQIQKYEAMLEDEELTIEDEVAIQSRIDQLEDQIYYLKNSLGNLEEDVEYSNLYVSLREKPTIIDETGLFDFREQGVKVLNALDSGVTFFIQLIGFLLPFGILYLLFRGIRRFF